MKQRADHDRVVITGMGALTPLGLSVADTWAGLIEGRSGVAEIGLFPHEHLPVQFIGEVRGFDATKHHPKREVRRMARFSQFATTTAFAAMDDAGLAYPFADSEAERCGIIFGSSMGGFDMAEKALVDYRTIGLKKVNPFSIASSLPNLSSFHVCVELNIQGYSNTTATSCASGTIALGEAAEVIRRGRADLMLAGGTEACITEGTILGFTLLRALSTRNDAPHEASRPFDADRDGFVMGEGGAIFVLERLTHAKARGARIYAEILGSAQTSTPYHIAIPDPEAKGGQRAMRWAMEDAGVTPAEIDYINAHGASTPKGDAAETFAIKQVFGDHAYRIPISATKSMTGHTLAATGAIEAVACVKTIETGLIHPTINYDTPDPTCDLDYVPNQTREQQVDTVLSNSFGLGGQNACLVLARFKD